MSEHVFNKVKWQSLSVFDQLGNIGSEVGRTLAAQRRGDNVTMKAAFYRGLDLLDATTEKMAEQRSPRTREVLRAREQFVQAVTTDLDDVSLEGYFMQFAMASRINR